VDLGRNDPQLARPFQGAPPAVIIDGMVEGHRINNNNKVGVVEETGGKVRDFSLKNPEGGVSGNLS